MTTGLYLSATSPNSGKSLIALGLADSLIKRADRVGFFRPVFDGATIADDPVARLIREHFNLSEEQVGGAVSMNDALALIAEGDTEEISSRAVSAYEKVAANSDVVIVDGAYLPANALAVEFDLNVQIARDLGLPVVAIVGAQEATVEEAVTAVDVARTELTASKADLLAVIVNRAEPALREDIEKSVKRGEANLPVYVLPEISELTAPTAVSYTHLNAVCRRRRVAIHLNRLRTIRELQHHLGPHQVANHR